MAYLKTCSGCAGKFETETFTQMRCTPGCGRKRPVHTKVCVGCGCTFETQRADKVRCREICGRVRDPRTRGYRIPGREPRPAPPVVPEVLPGEDRTFGGNELYVDPIPMTSHFRNARSVFRQCDWNRARRMVYARADRTCEICGDGPPIVHAHERFSYDPATGVQRLERLICVCPPCHNVIHFGRAQLMGFEQDALAQYIKVTGKTADEFLAAAVAYEPTYRKLCEREWTLDLSILVDVGLRLNPGFDGKLLNHT